MSAHQHETDLNYTDDDPDQRKQYREKPVWSLVTSTGGRQHIQCSLTSLLELTGLLNNWFTHSDMYTNMYMYVCSIEFMFLLTFKRYLVLGPVLFEDLKMK